MIIVSKSEEDDFVDMRLFSVRITRSIFERIWKFNYFAKPSLNTNESQIRQEIIATRLLFVVLLISCIVLVSYYSTKNVMLTHRIEFARYDEFVSLEKEEDTLSCRCSSLVVTHKDFIHLKYDLHPLCSSDFVKLEKLVYPNANEFFKIDFRTGAKTFFNSLSSLCQISAEYLQSSLMSFNVSTYVVNEAMNLETFTFESHQIIERFLSSTKRSFAQHVAMVFNITRNNGLMSGKRTNFGFDLHYGENDSILIDITPYGYTRSGRVEDFCICWIESSCIAPWTIFKVTEYIPVVVYQFAGLYTGCLSSESIRASTLICFFDQSCVDQISYWLNISHLKSMDRHTLENFDVNTTIRHIENQIFVDRWNISLSHRVFYDQCAPDRCTYTSIERNSIWLIVTIVFGLIGGLMKCLQVVIPYFVKYIFLFSDWYHRRRNGQVRSTISSRKISIEVILRYVRQLNLFPSEDPTGDDERVIRSQIVSSRIFIIVMIISVIILTIYSSQVEQIKTVTIPNPSMEQFKSLYQRYSETLICPCKKINILHQTFLIIQPKYHQVCHSDLINSQWINGISYTGLYANEGSVLSYDFRFLGSAIFATISSLCQLSLTTIDDAMIDFNASSLISTKVIPENQLIPQGQLMIDLFLSTNKDEFVSALQIVRDTIYANVLVSGFQTIGSIEYRPTSDTSYRFIMLPRTYNYTSSCTCSTDRSCIQPTAIYDAYSKGLLFTIPGMFIGCYMVEAALQSNLAFFYDQQNIDELRQMISFDDYNPASVRTTALNRSLHTYYNDTTSIDILMHNMMIESWTKLINYSAYYEQCHVIECKYTYTIKYDPIYIVTTITGLIGGLTTIYQLIIPRVVTWIRRYCFNRRRQTTISVESVLTN